MKHAQIIDRLGGMSELARRLDLAPSSVWRWQHAGIPIRRWRKVQQLARKVGLDLSLEELALGSPELGPPGRRANRNGVEQRASA